MLSDAQDLAGGQEVEVDLCIVGAGPAGVSVARELIGSSARVWLLDSGGTLSAAELRRLACDAGITPLVLGGPSEVLDYGRTRRSFPQAPRRALVVRDRGCIAPGCDRAPADCDAHHQTEWDSGGPTDLDNGALLCPYHHQQIHRQGWQVRLARNGYPHLIPPASIDPTRRPRQHHRFQLTQITTRRRT